MPKIGTILHVRFDHIRLRNCTGGPEPSTIQHSPFVRNAIDKAVVKLIKDDGNVPNFADGYEQWRKDCGGVYTISPAEVVEADEITFNRGLGCEVPQTHP